MEALLLALLLVGIAAVAFYLSSPTARSELRLPPGPPPVPLFGNLGILLTSTLPHKVLDRLARKYGPILYLKLGTRPAIVVSSPELAEEVLKVQDAKFASRPAFTCKDALVYGEDGIAFASYGQKWRFLRKVVTVEVLSFKRMQQFEPVRVDEAHRAVRSILDQVTESASKTVAGASPGVKMNEMALSFVTNFATRILMGKRFLPYPQSGLSPREEQDSIDPKQRLEFKEWAQEIAILPGVPIIGDFIPSLGFLDRVMNYKARMKRASTKMDRFISDMVAEHAIRQEQSGVKVPEDVIDVLLSLPQDKQADRLSNHQVASLTAVLLLSSVETTHITIEWALSELVRNPGVLIRVHEELDLVVGKERVVGESDLKNLPYFAAVVKEVFRLHSPLPLLIPHESTEDCQVCGYDIPAKTILFINIWSIHTSACLWNNPLEFLPDRFLNSGIDVQGQDYSLLPFGSGRRGCPGMNLGSTLVQYFLVRLVHSFDWCLPHGQSPENLDMRAKFGLTFPKAKSLMAVPKARLPLHLY